MNEEMETICFQIISYAGDAKSCYMEAIQEAKQNNFEQAGRRIQEGDKSFAQGHHVHAELIRRECSGESVPVGLVLIHAEDQMMSAEMTKMMAEEWIDWYRNQEEERV